MCVGTIAVASQTLCSGGAACVTCAVDPATVAFRGHLSVAGWGWNTAV